MADFGNPAVLPNPVTPSAAPPLPIRVPPLHARQPEASGLLLSLQSLLFVLIFALFLITFTVQPIRIPSASMEPTLLVGDFLLMDKQLVAPGFTRLLPPSGIARGDLIVFHDPIDDPAIHLVKRVIGLPGDRLHLHNGVVFLNGEPLHEPYAIHRAASPDSFRDDFPSLSTMDASVHPNWWIHLRTLVHQGEITVPPNNYFVLGDNRNNSEDSRYWGFVPQTAIVGKPLLIYFSLRQPGTDESNGSNESKDSLAPLPTTAHTSLARWERTFHIVH